MWGQTREIQGEYFGDEDRGEERLEEVDFGGGGRC
jgi:hypothetical protein